MINDERWKIPGRGREEKLKTGSCFSYYTRSDVLFEFRIKEKRGFPKESPALKHGAEQHTAV
jgi:hypothetical protein